MNDDLLQTTLAKLQRGDCPDSKYPDTKGEYWALCPYHADDTSGSFSVSERGYRCFACGESGGLRKLADKLGVAVLQANLGGYTCAESQDPATLAAYAKAKALPEDFLVSLDLADGEWPPKSKKGNPAIVMPYLDTGGATLATRYRIALSGDDKFRWAKGSRLHPYGLWRLASARKAGHVVLVEGESDAQTLWYHGIPALGIPGAGNWKPAWAECIQGLTVYLWREPDEGGSLFMSKVGGTLPDARIITPPDGRKDVSECHILGDDVPALVQRLIAEARPYAALHSEVVSQEAQEARRWAGALLACPDILAEFDKLCGALGLVGETKNARLLYLALTSRVLDRPVSVAVKGPSSGGKSYTVETVLKAFPQSAYLDFTSMSEHALAYDDRPIEHRFIVLYEASGLGAERKGEVNTLAYMLRSLLSEGCIKYTTVEKTQDGLVPKVIERDGPTGLITTTTGTSLHPENETRMLSIVVKDDAAQTRNVLEVLADRANGQGPARVDLAPWHALQEYLDLGGVRDVTIPYAHDLAAGTNPKAVRLRRDFGAVLNLIRTHAILHQVSRQRDAQGRIIATPEDYRTVHDLVSDLVNEGVEATVSQTIRDTVDAVRELASQNATGVTVTALARHLGLDKSVASRRAWAAKGRDYLVNLEDKRGKPTRLVVGEPLPEEQPVLPAPDSLALHRPTPSRNTATLQHSPNDEYYGDLADAQAPPDGGAESEV